jgi:hypothetical protein
MVKTRSCSVTTFETEAAISDALTSKVSLKINGKHKTLFTWFGKSERRLAIIKSYLTAQVGSGLVSGLGFDQARIIGLGTDSLIATGDKILENITLRLYQRQKTRLLMLVCL